MPEPGGENEVNEVKQTKLIFHFKILVQSTRLDVLVKKTRLDLDVT